MYRRLRDTEGANQMLTEDELEQLLEETLEPQDKQEGEDE